MNGVTYVEVNYDTAWVNNAIADVQGFSWLYEWGMYLFLLLTAAILFWIFFDSITKKKDQKALVPRILSMIGLFAIMPAFIFRFTGNADGVSTLVRLNAEPGAPYYPGPINWNVGWLVSGYGSMIAIIALAGVLVAVIALVIYMSSVQRSKPSTEFVQAFNSKMDNLENKVEAANRNAAAATAAAKATAAAVPTASAPAPAPAPAVKSSAAATIFDRRPQAATIIDVPKTGDTITVQSGTGRGTAYDLPANDITVGRDSKCYIVVDDGKVSRDHMRLSYRDGAWTAVDLGSANGTYVNGQRLSGQKQLANGDQIRIGDTVLAFGKA